MPSQRIILGIGLAILLVIGAASIGLDLKSRSDTESLDKTLGVLKRISDMRPLLRRVESAARGFALSNDPEFVKDYRDSSETILRALDDLIATVHANSGETRLLEETKTLVTRQIAINGELIRLQTAGDRAGVAALVATAESRAAAETIGSNLEKTVAEERRRLGARLAESDTNGG